MYEWILTKDKLPPKTDGEFAEQYITTSKYGSVDISLWYNGWNCTRNDRSQEIKGDYILAWTPLPEAYKRK